MDTTKQLYGTVLLKADKILNYLSSVEQPQSLQQIAKETALTSSTALKILDTLQYIGYVKKDDETKKFSIGTRIIQYANKAINQAQIKDIAQPYLEILRKQTTETVHLGMLDKNKIVYISKLESYNPVALYSSVGKSIPLYCSAMGKSILADCSNQEIDNYLNENELLPKTVNTITTREEFFEEINLIRKNGYAFDNGEHELDIFCVGASITVNEQNFGAFSVSVPKYRITDEFVEKIIEEVLICKKSIEDKLM
ncbi:IclR family transcriptional regulator [Fredinandcohnia sp. 179-A 10B2 NHS]|uniref:IclR family transcriptional regulator n=1 Tax=Fredinandcohnia sp. 179-A 10B2 NHS TaxID=3235176 RepID=UPI0039A12E9C